MKSDEKTLIDGLFSRLREAEGQSAPRDAEAEAQINQHLVRQPAAPYYMAQVVLIQEAALKRLDQRVKELEAQVAQLQQSRPSSGGFLSGLFGGGARDEPARPAGWGETRFSSPAAAGTGDMRPGMAPAAAAAPSRASGFLGGALQTAAGVAGGMLVADLLTGMFRHSQPQEIVEVIQDVPVDNLDASQFADPEPASERFADGDHSADGGFADGDFSDSDFNDDSSFLGDDDLFT
ncbi:DUF2076 domain-containing protein [Pseudomonas aeruginosa]|uniref:DUF2076 domain-containing protein n=2 Tax=Pseudomonas aeruginosa group TaxID=136841 RepID=UPI00071B2154|nr:DUF2076 domain-containing protein [Pseudomonas aeruginosa]KSR37314.1 ABC transporter substrate-binding protein [Pseudomonas aeruginosa]RPV14129.1 DUF2076 domain-containing protein [Pseudomonas aeruginosa]